MIIHVVSLDPDRLIIALKNECKRQFILQGFLVSALYVDGRQLQIHARKDELDSHMYVSIQVKNLGTVFDNELMEWSVNIPELVEETTKGTEEEA